MPVRTLLIDDHKLIREGVRSLIDGRDDIEVVGDAADLASGLAAVAANLPDVVLLDLNIPAASGIGIVREISAAAPDARIVILTMHAIHEYVIQAFAAGVHGYALKDQPVEEIVEAIRTVVAGGRYLAPTLPRALLDGHKADGANNALQALSPREREVFDLAVQGLMNEEIGTHLGISVKTVETHRAHVNRKLGIHSAAELIRYAARRGLVV